MWQKPFEARTKRLNVTTEGERRICVLVLALDWSLELAEGLPRAREADAALRAGDYKRVTIEADAADCRAVVTSPAHDGDRPGKQTLPEVHIRSVDLLAVQTKDEEIEVQARPTIAFRASDEALIFFAHHLGHSLKWKLERRQLELPGAAPRPKVAP